MAKFDIITESHNENESSQSKGYEKAKLTKKNKASLCKWKNEHVIKLLEYLIKHKGYVLPLFYS